MGEIFEKLARDSCFSASYCKSVRQPDPTSVCPGPSIGTGSGSKYGTTPYQISQSTHLQPSSAANSIQHNDKHSPISARLILYLIGVCTQTRHRR